MEQVEVNQADREAIAAYYRDGGADRLFVGRITAGDLDSDLHVQAIARHRQQSVEAALKPWVEAVEALNAHIVAMQTDCVKYLVPTVDPNSIEKDEFVSRMIYHLDGPEQNSVHKKARALLATRKEIDNAS